MTSTQSPHRSTSVASHSATYLLIKYITIHFYLRAFILGASSACSALSPGTSPPSFFLSFISPLTSSTIKCLLVLVASVVNILSTWPASMPPCFFANSRCIFSSVYPLPCSPSLPTLAMGLDWLTVARFYFHPQSPIQWWERALS